MTPDIVPRHAYAIGVDPGLATTGVAVLQLPDLRVIDLRLVKTEKASKKELRSTRMTGDDQRRLRELWDALTLVADRYQPVMAMGIEAYTPWAGRQGGNAWKVGLAYQTACCFCWARRITPFVFTPGDLKRVFAGRKNASKGDVGVAVTELVVGASEKLNGIVPSQQEHVTDALAHAYLAAEEWIRLRDMFLVG